MSTSHEKSWSFSVTSGSAGIPIWDEEEFDGTQHSPAQGKKSKTLSLFLGSNGLDTENQDRN